MSISDKSGKSGVRGALTNNLMLSDAIGAFPAAERQCDYPLKTAAKRVQFTDVDLFDLFLELLMNAKPTLWVCLLAVALLLVGVNVSAAESQTMLKPSDKLVTAITKLRTEKNWRGLIEQTNLAISQYPNAPDFFLARADAYRELKQYEPALADYARARRGLPDNPWPYLGTAEVYMAQRQPEMAEESLAAGLKIGPPLAQMLHLSTIANHFLGRKNLAEQRFTELRRVDPKYAATIAASLNAVGIRTEAPLMPQTPSEYSLSLQQALVALRDGEIDAAARLLSKLYDVDRRLVIDAGGLSFDNDIVNAFYVAEVLRLSLINASTIQGNLGRQSSAGDFAYALYEHYVKTRGAADSLAIRALAAAISVQAAYGHLPLALERATKGMILAGSNVKPADAALMQLAFSNLYSLMGRKREPERATANALTLLAGDIAPAPELYLLALIYHKDALFAISDAGSAEKLSEQITTNLKRMNRTNTIFAANQAFSRAQVFAFLGNTNSAVEWNQIASSWFGSAQIRTDRPQPLSTAGLLANVSWLATSFGDFAQAADLQGEATRLLIDDLGSTSPVAAVFEVALVPALIKAQRLEEALSVSRRVIPKLEAFRADLSLTDEDRMSVFSRVARAYRDSASLEIHKNPALSFRASEQSKARSLLESNMARIALTSGILDETDSSRIATIRRELLSLDQQIASARLIGESTSDVALRRQLLTNERTMLQRSFVTKYPKYARLTDVKLSEPAAVAASLQENEIFVSYLVTSDNLLIYVVTKKGWASGLNGGRSGMTLTGLNL